MSTQVHVLGAVRPASRFVWPVGFLLSYLAAITIFGKGPTYIGYPPVYWGELVLLSCLVWMTGLRNLDLLGPSELRPLSSCVLLFGITGVCIMIVSFPSWGIDAIRDGAVAYYAAFYFVGLNLALRPVLADRVWRVLRCLWIAALCWGILNYASQFVIYGGLANIGPMYPWRNVHILSNSNNELVQNVALGAILVLFSKPIPGPKAIRPLLMGAGVLGLLLFVAAWGRGVKVGICLGSLAVVAILLGKSRRSVLGTSLVRLGIAGVVLLLVSGLVWPRVWQMTQLDRFLEASPEEGETTAYWRVAWWKNLGSEVMTRNPAFGLGFGESLGVYNPFLVTELNQRERIRSPHNVNITVFARMGLVGVAAWLGVLACGIGGLFSRLWKGRFRKGRYDPQQREELLFWLLMIVATWVNSSFGVLMEGPVLGVWFWFALGFASGRSVCLSAKPAAEPKHIYQPRPMRVVFGVPCAS